jgi:hypothetical protein
MEIRDFVRANRRRLALLAVLPVMAAALALGVLWGEPEQYRASLEVVVLPEGNDPLSPNAIGQYVANFGEAVHSKPVKDAVLATAGIAGSDIERVDLNDVETRQIGRSNVIEVSYVGTRRALAKDVVAAAARETVLAVAQPQLDALAAARERHAAVAADHDAAVAALGAFTDETGLLIPEEEYQSRAAQLRVLQDNREEALGVGGSFAAAALEDVIAVRQAELDALGLQVKRFQELERQLDTSTEELRVAGEELRSAEAIAERSAISLDFSEVEATTLPRNERLVTGAAIAAGLTLVVGVALMVLLEMLRTRSLTPPMAGWIEQPQLALAPAPEPPAPAPAPANPEPPHPTFDVRTGPATVAPAPADARPGRDGGLPGQDSDIGQHLADAFAALAGGDANARDEHRPGNGSATRVEGRR